MSEASPLNLFDGPFSIVTSGLFTLCSDPEAKKGELTDTQSDMSQCDIVTNITDTKEIKSHEEITCKVTHWTLKSWKQRDLCDPRK